MPKELIAVYITIHVVYIIYLLLSILCYYNKRYKNCSLKEYLFYYNNSKDRGLDSASFSIIALNCAIAVGLLYVLILNLIN